METVNLSQLTVADGNIYLLGETPFSGFAIETFDDGQLRTQMSLLRGLEDGVTRRWHPNGQLESERSFRNSVSHGRHQEWRADGVLSMQATWEAGEQVEEWSFDEQGRPIHHIRRPDQRPQAMTYTYDAWGRLISARAAS
jgi:YD repeat-containing protein